MKDENKEVCEFQNDVNTASERLDARKIIWNEKYEEVVNGRRKSVSGFNRVVMMGRLTKDPEYRKTARGFSLTKMRLAVNEYFKKSDDEYGEKTCFIDLTAWGKQADNCAKYLKKGSPILVEGRLNFDMWETSDGKKLSKHEIRADRVQFLKSKKRTEREEPAPAVPASAEKEEYPF